MMGNGGMASQKRRKALALLSMIRPANSMMVGFAVVVGIAVSSHDYREVFTLTALLGFLTGFLISSFSMVSNDIYDLETDKINQPHRPLPALIVSIHEAKLFALTLLILGLIVSAILGMITLSIASVFAFVGWYYNSRGKALGLLGNSLVALSLAIPYIYGAVSIGSFAINLGYLLAITSFFAGLGREVLKGIADVEGDRARNIKTVAISSGPGTARSVSAGFFIVAVMSSFLPIILGLLGQAFWVYSILIGITDVLFVYLAFRVLVSMRDIDAQKCKTIALGGMMLGLVSYLVSGLVV